MSVEMESEYYKDSNKEDRNNFGVTNGFLQA
jgi:hypothetical protein